MSPESTMDAVIVAELAALGQKIARLEKLVRGLARRVEPRRPRTCSDCGNKIAPPPDAWRVCGQCRRFGPPPYGKPGEVYRDWRLTAYREVRGAEAWWIPSSDQLGWPALRQDPNQQPVECIRGGPRWFCEPIERAQEPSPGEGIGV